jgi:hypothetical protein
MNLHTRRCIGRLLALAGGVLASGSCAVRPPIGAIAIAQAQLDAYNRRDLSAFVAWYHPDVEVFDLPSQTPRLRGLAAFRARYERLFARSPTLHARLIARLSQGRFVVDQERVTGFPGASIVRAIAIYEVERGLIRRVWFLK